MSWQIGEWDGVTPQLSLSTPYARSSQPQANGAWRSFFLQPWRGYMDTWPASRLLGSMGINFNPAQKYMPGVMQILAQSGFKTIRFELGFGYVSYSNPNTFVSAASNNTQPIINLCLQYGLRPLVTLNSNGTAPCPTNTIVTQASAGNIGDTTITITGSMTGIRAGYTGMTAQGFYQTACPLIIAIVGNVCTLSQPLAKAFPAGNITLVDMLWHPFSAEAYSQSGSCTNANAIVTGLSWAPQQGATVTGTGIPANTTVLSVDSATQIHLSNNFTGTTGPATLTFTSTFADETVNGWMTYLADAGTYLSGLLGPSGFDVEVWNELTFGSQYLNESNYYNPARTVATPVTYTNYGLTWGNSGITNGDITYVLTARTVDFFKTNYPGVKVIDGFSNTVVSINPSNEFWPYCAGFSRHGYTASDLNHTPYDGAKGACSPGAGNAAPDYPTVGPWKYDVNGYEGTVSSGNNVVSGSYFVPVFNLACPEAVCLGSNANPLLRDWQAFPDPQGRWRGVTSPAPASNTAEWWETEYNWDTTGFRQYITGLGFSVTDPRFIYLNQWIQAKSLLRAWVFHIHKGLNKLVLYAVTNGDPLTFQVFPAAFFSAMDASGDVLTPNVLNQVGPQIITLQNTYGFLNANSSGSFTVNPVTVNGVIEYQPRLVVLGDGTASNPTLTNVDEYGIFPFQLSNTSYAISHYVVTRNAVHSYNQGTDGLDTLRYTMPDQTFDISFSIPSNPNLQLSAIKHARSYDPLNNSWKDEQILSSDSTNMTVRVTSTDYPRFLYLGTNMAATRFGNPTSGAVSFTNAEVQALQEAVQKLFEVDNSGMWWNTTPQSLLTELTTEVQSNRSLTIIPVEP